MLLLIDLVTEHGEVTHTRLVYSDFRSEEHSDSTNITIASSTVARTYGSFWDMPSRETTEPQIWGWLSLLGEPDFRSEGFDELYNHSEICFPYLRMFPNASTVEPTISHEVVRQPMLRSKCDGSYGTISPAKYVR